MGSRGAGRQVGDSTRARRRARWAVEVRKRGGRKGGRVLRRGSAEAAVARLAIRGGLAATAAGALATTPTHAPIL